MVRLLLVNTAHKYVYGKYFENGVPALKFLDSIYHIPPQGRYVRVIMYVVEYEPTSVERRIENYYLSECLTKDEIDLYRTYPFYNFKKKEVIRDGRD